MVVAQLLFWTLSSLSAQSTTLPLDDGFAKGQKFLVSTITKEQANQLIKEFKADSRIPFDFGIDGCNERAQLMTSIAAHKNIELGKVFVDGTLYADNSESSLKAKMPEDTYDWVKHVATVVHVKEGSKVTPMIIDPSLSDQPMSESEFKEKIQVEPKSKAANGQEKASPKIDRFIYGSRHQYTFPDQYPAKLPKMDMKSFDRLAERRLRNIDYMASPGSPYLKVTEAEYCEKHGFYCKDSKHGEEIRARNALKESKFPSAPYQSCDGEAESASSGKASLPDGFTEKERIQTSVLTEAEAVSLFNSFKNDKSLDFNDDDNCTYRAHFMVESARKKGIELAKVFAEGDLRAKARDGATMFGYPVKHIAWSMHVAPVVVVVRSRDGKLKKMVLDPATGDGPVEMSEFKKKLLYKAPGQKDDGSIQKFYCADRYQFDAKKDLDAKLAPHNMDEVTKQKRVAYNEGQKFKAEIAEQIKAAMANSKENQFPSTKGIE